MWSWMSSYNVYYFSLDRAFYLHVGPQSRCMLFPLCPIGGFDNK